MNVHDILHNSPCLDYQHSDNYVSDVSMLANTAKLALAAAKCYRIGDVH